MSQEIPPTNLSPLAVFEEIADGIALKPIKLGFQEQFEFRPIPVTENTWTAINQKIGVEQLPAALIEAGDEVFSVNRSICVSEEKPILGFVVTRLVTDDGRAQIVGIVGEGPLHVGRNWQPRLGFRNTVSRNHFGIHLSANGNLVVTDTSKSSEIKVITSDEKHKYSGRILSNVKVWSGKSIEVKELLIAAAQDKKKLGLGETVLDKSVVIDGSD